MWPHDKQALHMHMESAQVILAEEAGQIREHLKEDSKKEIESSSYYSTTQVSNLSQEQSPSHPNC